jgi:hypothetical protein
MKYEGMHGDKFHVVTCLFNPCRFSRRYELYHKFVEYVKRFTDNIWTVEASLGHRDFVTDGSNPKNIQLRTKDELWLKENLLNIAISRLPSDFEAVAWVDADIEFQRADWFTETLHQLQVYEVVQMWSTAIDLGPDQEALALHHSFMSQYLKHGSVFPEGPYHEWHPGYAWAANRRFIEEVGLYDRAIMGAGDRHMALAMIGNADKSLHPRASEHYKKSVLDWQERCEKILRRDVGCVNQNLYHFFHGRKKLRQYWDRWKVITDHLYDPYKDVKYNHRGILQLHDDGSMRFLRLRDKIRAYNRARNDNSIDLD